MQAIHGIRTELAENDVVIDPTETALVSVRAKMKEAFAKRQQVTNPPSRVPRYDEVFRQGKEWLDNLADPRVASQSGSIILSDNIQPRCGCSKPGIWQLQRDLLKQGKSLEVVAIATCPRCEAAWLWGEP